jgi:hypothetical protein
MKKILESGLLGVGTAALAKNPEMLKGFGVLGNLAARSIEREKDKEAAGSAANLASPSEEKNTTKMRKGGYVKSADGICKRGRTKGRIV